MGDPSPEQPLKTDFLPLSQEAVKRTLQEIEIDPLVTVHDDLIKIKTENLAAMNLLSRALPWFEVETKKTAYAEGAARTYRMLVNQSLEIGRALPQIPIETVDSLIKSLIESADHSLTPTELNKRREKELRLTNGPFVEGIREIVKYRPDKTELMSGAFDMFYLFERFEQGVKLESNVNGS